MNKQIKSNTYSKRNRFLLLGGDPVLDFCNTLVFHGDVKEDRLLSVEDAENFWQSFFEDDCKFNRRQLDDLLELRTELRELFKLIVEKRCSEDSFKKVNKYLGKHPFVFRIDFLGDSIVSSITSTKEDPTTSLVYALHSFLGKFDLTRLKKCNNPNCSHFFYDKSKNNLRVWCSMKTCGNIMKARAFHQRKRNGV